MGFEPKGRDRSGIRTAIRAYDPGGTDTAVAIAICAPDAALPPIRLGVQVDGEASGGPRTATCEPGKIAVGGGVHTQSGALGMQAISQRRPANVDEDGVATGWRGGYLNDADPDGVFGVQVLCAEPWDDFTVVTGASAVVPLPPGALATATAECPQADQIAIGGGVSGTSSLGLVASQPGALVDGQLPRGP